MNTKTIGIDGEEQAVCELIRLGYEIVERNYQTRYGELDIIAKDNHVLVFVEVKKKRSNRFGTPAEMVTKKKIHKIINMAEYYRAEKKQKGPFRVDVVSVLGDVVEVLENVTNS